jgi:hypothetical protein
MGKKKKIEKGPRRAIATTAVKSKNEELGISSEREKLAAELEAKAKAEADAKTKLAEEEKALAEKKSKEKALREAALAGFKVNPPRVMACVPTPGFARVAEPIVTVTPLSLAARPE